MFKWGGGGGGGVQRAKNISEWQKLKKYLGRNHENSQQTDGKESMNDKEQKKNGLVFFLKKLQHSNFKQKNVCP